MTDHADDIHGFSRRMLSAIGRPAEFVPTDIPVSVLNLDELEWYLLDVFLFELRGLGLPRHVEATGITIDTLYYWSTVGEPR